MEKQIFTIGYTIPGFDKNEVDFYNSPSLMDSDILLLSPKLSPRGNYGSWIEFSLGGGCYNASTSSEYEKKISHLKKEIGDLLRSGKTVFIILSAEESYMLSSGVSSPRKGQNLHSTYLKTNYSFLPISIGNRVSASGKNIEFSGNPAINDFFKKFKTSLEYQLYVENPNGAQIIFTGKDKTKVLGAIYKVGEGNLVTLPSISYDRQKFIEYKGKGEKEKAYWNKEAVQFGKSLVQVLVDIDKALRKGGDKTPPPEWSQEEKYITKKEQELVEEVSVERRKIEAAEKKIKDIDAKLDDIRIINGLLFEQGKPLEQAVTKALHLLGYSAERHDDGNLELDQVITSPEGYRYIGECEGKDNKDIDITKFRQLSESLSADFHREEVSEKAFGILFGNPQRLISPKERTLDFTQKCKIGAAREKIALIKTEDLFVVAKHLLETDDDLFKKDCREAIHSSLGGIVVFPSVSVKK